MTKKPALNDWAVEFIIYSVRKTGTTLSALSEKHGLARGVLLNALYKPKYPRYEKLIADHLNTTPQTIWPSRYHEDGRPRSGRGERGIGRYKAKHKHSTPDNNKRNDNALTIAQEELQP